MIKIVIQSMFCLFLLCAFLVLLSLYLNILWQDNGKTKLKVYHK